MIRVYTQLTQGQQWLRRHQASSPIFACILGFTDTCLIPGISAAGATPAARQYTAIADAEFLHNGPEPQPQHPLPPLQAGASPVLISRAVVEALSIPVYLFNSGLPQPPTVPAIDLGGTTARCLSQGRALELATVKHLLEQGLIWGERLAASIPHGYLIVGECVVGGTTTALAVLTGLGIAADGKVNSSHPVCNHAQKWALVQSGLQCAGLWSSEFGGASAVGGETALKEGFPPQGTANSKGFPGLSQLAFRSSEFGVRSGEMEMNLNPKSKIQNPKSIEPLQLVAAVGDPMQITAAGMAIAASRTCGVLLAGGTQMLAVYALIQAVAEAYALAWEPEQVVVGTTRWVAADPTCHTVGLAQMVGSVPLLATQLNFGTSRYAQLRAYEQGFVKEGMGAGGCAIAAHLTGGWDQTQLLEAVEALINTNE